MVSCEADGARVPNWAAIDSGLAGAAVAVAVPVATSTAAAATVVRARVRRRMAGAFLRRGLAKCRGT